MIVSHPGLAFGAGDLLVAAIAAENAALVWSLDSAFDRLEQLRLISQYDPNARS